jgi:hypothetical protein
MGRCDTVENAFAALDDLQPNPEMTEDPVQDLKK